MVSPELNEQSIFEAARKIESIDAREAYLQQVCADQPTMKRRVSALLLDHLENASFLEAPPPGMVPELTIEQAHDRVGTQMGRYKLLEQLGEGGMGVVYVAEQTEPVRRRVALKIIKPGMDTKQVIARFEAERQALAMMDHPNIARIYDAGTTEGIGSREWGVGQATTKTPTPDSLFPTPSAGRPYFVMELVRGMPITEYCDQARQSPRERLELFIDVCQAVQHAHQKGIIHRDLKPSNVLVTTNDGRAVVKVIDFGVAKAVGQQLTERTVYTALTQLVGTPLYMSPEQAELTSNDVDTRSDVYSLGVLLYELLTGQTPFDKERMKSAGFDEMRRIIREEEPPRPSHRISTLGAQASSTISQQRSLDERHLGRVLRGELDWIVMKSLEKDRARRYESASALGADIQRYLFDEPVLACPPSAMYRFQKFARTNRPALVTASAIAACLLLGTTVSAWQAVRATTAEAQATANEQRASANASQAQEKAKEATEQRDEAQRQRDEVQALNDKLQRTLYAANIKLAQVAWDEAAIPQLRELLDQHHPKQGEPDLRGFEWYYLNRLCHPELLTFKGHGGWVQEVVFSPDGEWIASAGRRENEKKYSIKVWNAKTGVESLTIPDANCVAFSPDGVHLAGDSRGMVRIWKAHTGEEVLSLKGPAGSVEAVAFSADGNCLGSVAMTWDDERNTYVPDVPAQLKVWDVKSGRELFTCPGGGWGLAFSPDGKKIATGEAKAVKIWEAETGRALLTINRGGMSVAFSPDSKRLASYGAGLLCVSNAESGQELLSIKENARALTFSPNGNHLATARGDRTIKVWDSHTGEEVTTYKGHENLVTCVAYSSDGAQLASSSLDGTVRVWDAKNRPEARTMGDGAKAVRNLAFSADNNRVAGITRDNKTQETTIKVWDIKTGRVLLSLQGKTGETLLCVALSPDGRQLAAGGGNWDDPTKIAISSQITIWDAESGRELLSFKAHADGARNVVFSPDSQRLASNGRFVRSEAGQALVPDPIKIWDAKTGRELLSLKGHANSVNDLIFSRDGKRLATHSRDGTTKIWDAETGRDLLTVTAPTPPQGNGSLAFSPDGKRLATSSRAPGGGIGPGAVGEVKVWNTETGDEVLTLKGHTSAISSIAYSPDGKRIASASGSAAASGVGEVKIWNAETGQDLLTFKGGSYGHHIAFSPSGHLLASNANGTISLYDATPVPAQP